MDEKFIAKREDKILTRAILEVGNEKYIEESVYSDEDTIDLLIMCLEGFAFSHNFTRKDIIKAMRHSIANRNEDFMDCLHKFSSIANNTLVKITIEQYSKRVITERESSINVIRTIIDCIIAANIQNTWCKNSIIKAFEEYIDEYYSEEDEELEDDSNDNDILADVAMMSKGTLRVKTDGGPGVSKEEMIDTDDRGEMIDADDWK